MFSRLFPGASGFRVALRALSRRPGSASAAVLTLALGIGATTAVFGVVYGVLIRPLPYPDADELVSLGHTAPGHPAGLAGARLGSTESMYLTYRDENRTFEQVGLWTVTGGTLAGQGDAEQIRVLAVTGGVLDALQVQPALGRSFLEAELGPGTDAPNPVILSHAMWQRRFGGDPDVVGRSLSLDFRPVQVIGVMPAGFRFLDLEPQPDVIGPFRIDESRVTLGNLNYGGIARLKDGASVADANADVARMLPIWLDAWPAEGGAREAATEWRLAPALAPLKDDVVGGVAGMLWMLMGTVGAVLLIACANVANLLLARADARRQELAIRAALGAGRTAIAAELLRESLVLGIVGGAGGVALAYVGIKLLAALTPPNLPRAEAVALDAPVLAFAVVAALASSLAFGSIPALKHSFAHVPGAGTRGASASRERNRTRHALMAVQVALALVLLVGAGLMVRTFHALGAVDPGFTKPEEVQVMRVFIPPGAVQDLARSARIQRDILERIRALPGVAAAGFGGLPLGGSGGAPGVTIVAEDRPDIGIGSGPTVRVDFASPGHLEALGTRLVAGRGLSWADTDDAGGAVLVAENLARRLWGDPQTAIGKRIRLQSPWEPPDVVNAWHEIVGVMQDVHQELYEPAPATVYRPVSVSDLRVAAYAIRSGRAGTEGFVSELRQVVRRRCAFSSGTQHVRARPASWACLVASRPLRSAFATAVRDCQEWLTPLREHR